MRISVRDIFVAFILMLLTSFQASAQRLVCEGGGGIVCPTNGSDVIGPCTQSQGSCHWELEDSDRFFMHDFFDRQGERGDNGSGNGNDTGDVVASGSTCSQTTVNTPPISNKVSFKNNPATNRPVVIGSGTKEKGEVDFVFGGEMPLFVERSYNSAFTRTGIFGNKWFSNLDYKLEFVGGSSTSCPAYWKDPDCVPTSSTVSQINVFRGNAEQYSFYWNPGNNRWEDLKVDSISTLVKEANGTWTLRHEDHTIESYDSTGKILSIKDDYGVGLTFTYPTNQIVVTHSTGQRIIVNLSGGKVSSIVDPANNSYTYTYAASGMLSQVNYPNSLGYRTYHYESSYSNQYLTGISISGVRYSRYTYLSNGQVSASGLNNGVESSTFSYGASSTTVTNALGGATTYNYTNDNNYNLNVLAGASRGGTTTCAASASQL